MPTDGAGLSGGCNLLGAPGGRESEGTGRIEIFLTPAVGGMQTVPALGDIYAMG